MTGGCRSERELGVVKPIDLLLALYAAETSNDYLLDGTLKVTDRIHK